MRSGRPAPLRRSNRECGQRTFALDASGSAALDRHSEHVSPVSSKKRSRRRFRREPPRHGRGPPQGRRNRVGRRYRSARAWARTLLDDNGIGGFLSGLPGTPRRIPFDAKCKECAAKGIHASDVHQLARYAQVYAVDADPSTVLVFPEPGRASRRDLSLTGPAGILARITVPGIGTEREPAAASAAIHAALAETAPLPMRADVDLPVS